MLRANWGKRCSFSETITVEEKVVENSNIIVVGTDTDVGKTIFSALWLTAFPKYSYWKPIETGVSDSATLRRLVPQACVHQSLLYLSEAVAPALAARRAGVTVPDARKIVAAKPSGPLLIETFGSPFSPLDEKVLQIELIRQIQASVVLIGTSSVGAIGRALSTFYAMRSEGVEINAIVLLGEVDAYAVEQLQKCVSVFSLPFPFVKSQTSNGELTPEILAMFVHRYRSTFLALAESVKRKYPVKGAVDEFVLRDRKAVWHPYTSLKTAQAPLPVRGAYQEFLQLLDGRELIDGISSWWTILHGHRHPVLMRALGEAMTHYDHVMFAGLTHEPAVILAEQLLKSCNMPEGRVFYSDNGSTAVEVALKLAYQYFCHRGQPQRCRFIGFEGGYHGDTFGAMAVSRDPIFFGRFEPLLFAADIIPLTPEALDQALSKHLGEVAAVILEPLLQAAGGMRMHTAEQLEAIVAVAKAHDVLFIADEVMTGGGRLGSRWATQKSKALKPDLICAGKTLTGGIMPLAVTMASAHIVSAFDSPERSKTFFHGHSFTAHPLACAVAVANQAIPTIENTSRIETFWRRRLPLARVCGSVVAIDIEAKGGYLAEVGQRMYHAALEQGVLLRPLGNVLYAMPPLETSDISLERIAQAFEAAMAAGNCN